MDDTQLDVIAVGAHPDDVEIGCGGTLARLVEQGYRVGIVDLTDGEPTPGSPGPEVRLAEARKAAETLGVHVRVTLELPNRRLFDGFEARVALARSFASTGRGWCWGWAAARRMASPDHYQAMLITEAAVFYSKLTKWEEHFDEPAAVHRAGIDAFPPGVPQPLAAAAGGAGGRHRPDAGEEDRGGGLLPEPVSARATARLGPHPRVQPAARPGRRLLGRRSARQTRRPGHPRPDGVALRSRTIGDERILSGAAAGKGGSPRQLRYRGAAGAGGSPR